jgi:uncharacterized protein
VPKVNRKKVRTMQLVKNMVRGLLWPRNRSGKIRMIVAGVLLVVMGIAGCGAGNRLFYWPNDILYNSVVRHGVVPEDVWFTSADGTKLHGWYIASRTSPVRGTVIHFHGNAQNLTAHYAAVSWLPDEGYNTFLFDYRGFGHSEGTATREGTFQDSVAALEYIAGRADQQNVPLVAFGQSLGGALCLASLGESGLHGVRGIAVESTFYSYQQVGQAHLNRMWWTWAVQWPLSRWLLTDDHSPSHSLAKLTGTPLLVIHGDNDDVVMFSEGRKLFDRAGEPKEFVHVPGGTHAAAIASRSPKDKRRYRAKLLAFYARCLEEQSER